MRDGILQPFAFHTFTLVPKLSFSPAGSYEISYEGGLRRSSSSFGNPLWDTNHRLSLHYTHRRLDASVSGEYFRNQIDKNNSVNLFFLDASAAYKLKKLSFWLQLTNLLNHGNYSYTQYNPLSTHSSQMEIRAREVLLGVRMAF